VRRRSSDASWEQLFGHPLQLGVLLRAVQPKKSSCRVLLVRSGTNEFVPCFLGVKIL
jgi:hypothetical protein